MGWNGCVFFKKETPKLFRLEVYPFIPFSRAWSMIYAPRSFAMGRFCFAQKYIKGYTFLSIIIERVFPMNLKKQLACIYTNNFFSGLRITDAVWVALLAARGFSLWEIGVAESVFHMVSLTFEVPSGMAADLLGRRKTLVAGGVCMVLSNLLMAFAPDLFSSALRWR